LCSKYILFEGSTCADFIVPWDARGAPGAVQLFFEQGSLLSVLFIRGQTILDRGKTPLPETLSNAGFENRSVVCLRATLQGSEITRAGNGSIWVHDCSKNTV
jgi:hypothetical protein